MQLADGKWYNLVTKAFVTFVEQDKEIRSAGQR